MNCGNVVEDRYCPYCGQENLKIQDSVFHLMLDYIKDMFHYDGRFWHTLFTLIVKPGLVATEYMEGKRRRNLEPLRFYVFASTLFFLLLFYLVSPEKWNKNPEPKFNLSKRLYNLHQEKNFVTGNSDTVHINFLINSLQMHMDSMRHDSNRNNLEVDLSHKLKPDTASAGWIGKFIEKRAEQRRKELEEKHQGDQVSAATDIVGEIFHKLPQLLFLSLPFFAFCLKLLYIRSSKLNYVGHFIFSIYHFSYLFVIMSLFILIQYLIGTNEEGIVNDVTSYISGGLILYGFIYLLLSMKRFYHDRWRYLIPRYLLLLSLFFIIILILFVILAFVVYLW